MKIVLCSSVVFYEQLPEIEGYLGAMGHKTVAPSGVEENKSGALLTKLFKDIEESDAVLVCNYEKNGVSGYIGGNSLIEMSHAFYCGKKILLLNNIPVLSYRDEIEAMSPVVVGEDLSGFV